MRTLTCSAAGSSTDPGPVAQRTERRFGYWRTDKIDIKDSDHT